MSLVLTCWGKKKCLQQLSFIVLHCLQMIGDNDFDQPYIFIQLCSYGNGRIIGKKMLLKNLPCRYYFVWVFPWYGLQRIHDGWLHFSMGRSLERNLGSSCWNACRLRLPCVFGSSSGLLLRASWACQMYWKSWERGQCQHCRSVSKPPLHWRAK